MVDISWHFQKTSRKESQGQWLTFMLLQTARGAGVAHILLRRTKSSISSSGHQRLSVWMPEPWQGSQDANPPLFNFSFFYFAVGYPRQDLRERTMNISCSKVLNMGSIDGCIQPPGKVKSRLSFSSQVTCSNMDIRAVEPPQLLSDWSAHMWIGNDMITNFLRDQRGNPVEWLGKKLVMKGK